ncbi:MAG: carbohydrate ABC transporter permease [Thermoleophilia bacterium]
MNGRRRPLAVAVGSRVALLAVTFLLSLPLLYLVSISLRQNDDVLNGSWLPPGLYWENFSRAFDTIALDRMLANSWIVAIGASLLTAVVAVPAAYFTARSRRHGARLATFLLAAYCAPPVVAMLPLFFLWRDLGLLNGVLGLVLINGFINVPVAVWLLDGFIRRVPVEVEEAAALDGLGTGRILLRIVVPLIAPGLVAAILICLFLTYNEFLFAVSFSQTTDSQTVTVGLSLFQGDRTVQYGQQAAASLIAIAPMYLLAVGAQRWLVSGLSAGAVK